MNDDPTENEDPAETSSSFLWGAITGGIVVLGTAVYLCSKYCGSCEDPSSRSEESAPEPPASPGDPGA